MKEILHNCGRLEVRHSPIEGYGIFALGEIQKGEVLEEIPFILFPKYTSWGKDQYDWMTRENVVSEREKYIENLRENFQFKTPEKYYFKWHPPAPHIPGGEEVSFTVLPLGYGPIYNTSNTDNNASWKIDEKLFVFVAEKDIKKDEEIKTFYGYFLDDKGNIFNVETVFFMGLDYCESGVRLKNVRYAHPNHVQLVKNNQEYMRLITYLSQAKDNEVKLVKAEAGGHSFDFPPNYPLDFHYQKLQEFYKSKFEFVNVTVEYVNKDDGQTVSKLIQLPNKK